MIVVKIETEPNLELGQPELLFETQNLAGIPGDYDMAPDGQRFLILKKDSSARIVFVTNWLEDLKRQIPTD